MTTPSLEAAAAAISELMLRLLQELQLNPAEVGEEGRHLHLHIEQQPPYPSARLRFEVCSGGRTQGGLIRVDHLMSSPVVPAEVARQTVASLKLAIEISQGKHGHPTHSRVVH